MCASWKVRGMDNIKVVNELCVDKNLPFKKQLFK
jgi:hypothetical protein